MPKDISKFKVDQYELKILAKHYLNHYFELKSSEFLTGHYCGSDIDATRSNVIEEYLDRVTWQEIIDEVDKNFRKWKGDGWECFKKMFKPNFFSTPPNENAILREVKQLPQIDMDEDKFWDLVSDTYSPEYADVLRQASEAEFVKLMKCSDEEFHRRSDNKSGTGS